MRRGVVSDILYGYARIGMIHQVSMPWDTIPKIWDHHFKMMRQFRDAAHNLVAQSTQF
jgi:hypothetical protein